MSPSHYTNTRRWLERRFRTTTDTGTFFAHMPIYGHRHPDAEVQRLPRLARALQVLRVLDRVEFDSVLDVGSAEGFLPWVVHRTFGADVTAVDLSIEACKRADDLFGVRAVACDADRLPFGDDAFDIVVSCETIEHVEYPVHVLLELLRVARRAVILTTEEMSFDRAHIERWLAKRCGYPHGERNRFHPDDLRTVFGTAVELRSQFLSPRPAEPFSDADARAWIASRTTDDLDRGGAGVVALAILDASARRPEPRFSKDELIDSLLGSTIPAEPLRPDRVRRADPATIARLVCPITRTPVTLVGGVLRSTEGREYPLDGGVPVMHARDVLAPSRDELIGRLAEASPDDPARRAGALALHDSLFVPDSTGRTEWTFEGPADLVGWSLGDQLQLGDAAGHELHLRSLGGDPYIVGPTMPFAVDAVAAFEIDLRIDNPEFARDAGVGQLYWLCNDDVTFREEASVTFPVVNDGEVHRYVIDPRDGVGWPPRGDLVCIRVDPVNGPCALDLVRVGIRLSATEQT